MTGLVPVIRPNASAFGGVVKLLESSGLAGSVPAWMAGTSPAMTELAVQIRARYGDFADPHSTTISAWPYSTGDPSSTKICVILPARGATISL